MNIIKCYPKVVSIIAFMGLILVSGAQAQISNGPTGLLCEYIENPLGIDAKNPRLSWKIFDKRPAATQSAYQLAVNTASGKEIWNSGKIASGKSLIPYEGRALEPFTRYYWNVTCWDKDGNQYPLVGKGFFETGVMEQKNWVGGWISDGIDQYLQPAPYFRKTFNATKTIKSARAYIAVAGLYELFINGQRIGDRKLDPAYTRFDRRNLYVTYDITNQMKNGANAIGVLLGNGWYNHQSNAVWYFHKAPWRSRPAFCMDLHITYEDGHTEIISTGRDWKTSLSPIIFNSIYTAEHYDGRLEIMDWNTPDFDDSKWKQAVDRAAPSQNIVAQAMHPIREVEKITSAKMMKFSDTDYVYDLGRNISGVSELSVIGDSGTVIHLKHGERVYESGHVDQSNIDVHYRPLDDKDPYQTDIFILKGKDTETFKPLFNYKGFQYVEVTSNKPITLNNNSLNGYFMHSDVPPIGSIETSDPLINKIWKATNNSYLSNFLGYPTDCPQREKNGWTGDAHIAVETGLYNFDGITVYEKWLADHRDEQQPNGVLPAIIPTSGWGYQWANGPDWTSTIAIIPWNLYLFYGDTKPLADNYESIKKYVDHINQKYPDGLTTWGLGDWVPVKSVSPVELTSSIYYFTDVSILARAAKLLNKTTDAEKYKALAQIIKTAINKKYLNEQTGMYGNGLQTELSAPLYWGLVPEGLIPKVAANLAQKIRSDGFKPDVGILGAKALLNALSEHGYADEAYKIASAKEYPSWGWWIVNGATTLYENWNIDSKSDVSLNHIMFGEIGAWLFKALGGIFPDPDNPGFKNVWLKPNFVVGLNTFKSTHDGPFGQIVSCWKRQKKNIIYEVIIPANATATLAIPAKWAIKNKLSGMTQQVSAQGNSSYFLPAGTYKMVLVPN